MNTLNLLQQLVETWPAVEQPQVTVEHWKSNEKDTLGYLYVDGYKIKFEHVYLSHIAEDRTMIEVYLSEWPALSCLRDIRYATYILATSKNEPYGYESDSVYEVEINREKQVLTFYASEPGWSINTRDGIRTSKC